MLLYIKEMVVAINMTPIDFSLELETAINKQIGLAADNAATGLAPIMSLINSFQQTLLQLLTESAAVDTGLACYPAIDLIALLGPEATWQQATQTTLATIAETDMQLLAALWSMYALLDKSAQYYQQAAAHSVYPTARIFFQSLYESKKVVRLRLAGIIQIVHNHYWGELGFAPFVFAKE